MFSGAGGAEARRRRGVRSLFSFIVTLLFLWLLSSTLSPTFPHLQPILPPHLAATSCPSGARGFLPASHRCSPRTSLRTPKMANSEALSTNRFKIFTTSESCLFHPYRFARSGTLSGFLSRIILSLVTVNELCFTMKMAKEKSLKSNRCPPFEPEINLSHVPRYLAALVKHRSHRFTQSLTPVTMMNHAAEGSTLTHKPSSVPDLLLALLSSWLINRSPSPSLSLILSLNQWPPQSSSMIKEIRSKTLMSLMDSPLNPLDRSPLRLMASFSFKNYGPSLSPLWPRWVPIILLQKSRFDQDLSLFFLSKFLSRFMNSIDRGHQLEHNPPLLLDWYTIYLRTMSLEPPRAIILEIKILKKIGIMIPSPRSGGYRSFFNILSPPPLSIELIQVQISKFMDNFQTFKSLKNNGIMTPSPRRGGYRSFSNLLYPAASSVEHFLKGSYALIIARAVSDHPLVEDFAKPVFMVESAMASTDFPKLCKPFKVEHLFGKLMEPLSLLLLYFLNFSLYELPSFEALSE